MVHFTIVSLLIIFSLYQICTQDFGPIDADIDVTALYKLEERMLPALDAFISAREDHLKELEYTLSKSASSRVLSREDIGEYLGNPLNQFHVVKRFVDEWGQLDEYLNSDSSTDDLLAQMTKEQNQIPGKAELAKSVRDLEKSNGIDPGSYRVML